MRSRRSLVLGGVAICLFVVVATVTCGACSSIVGVEDVQLKKPAAADGTGTPPEGDDDAGDPLSSAETGPGNVVGPACNGAIACERRMFATKATFTGNLGGLAGADQKCTEAAKANPDYGGRSFRAWLSDSMTNAATRIPNGTKPFRRPDGSVLAATFADLTDGTILVPPMLDETGAVLAGTEFDHSVWTSTSAKGLYNGSSCADWKLDTAATQGGYGNSQTTDVSWTEIPASPVAESPCNAMKHLYCIEY